MLPAAAACAALLLAAAPPQAAAGDPYILVLGTAQDGGIPHAACSCPQCDTARRNPEARRSVASVAIVIPATGRRFLIDASPDLREQLRRLPEGAGHPKGVVDRRPVDGVLLTHAHVGHYLGLAYFGFEAIHTSRLPVFATPRLSAFLAGNRPWSRLVDREEIELREMPPGVAIPLDAGVRVTPFSVPHRDEDSDTVGFKIEGPRHAIVYVPDTDTWTTWSPEALAIFWSCDTALVDGTFYTAGELPGRDVAKIGHPLITATMDRFQQAVREKRLRLLFTHLNHSNRALVPKGPERREIGRRGFEVARDGQRLPL